MISPKTLISMSIWKISILYKIQTVILTDKMMIHLKKLKKFHLAKKMSKLSKWANFSNQWEEKLVKLKNIYPRVNKWKI
jgi:hypothetical protein